MPVVVTCATCAKQFTVPDHYAGRSGACTQCGASMQVPADAAKVALGSPGSDEQLSAFGSPGAATALLPTANVPVAAPAAAPAPAVATAAAPAAGAPRSANIGNAIAGYKLQKKLGDAKSTVVMAESPTGARVAVKILPQQMVSRSPTAAKRFLRESRSLFGLVHPNVATVLDAGEELGNLYLVMEYFEGRTLREVIAERKQYREPEAVKVARQVASALGHLSKNKLLHRNVKPEHILVDSYSTVKLVGLGLVRGEDDSAPVTQQGLLVGTAQYLAPENSDAHVEVDHRADFFALGVTLYEMLTGEVPWLDKSPMRTVQMVRNNPTPNLRDKNAGVSPATVLVVEKLLAKDPKERYQSADVLVQDLDAIERLQLVDGRPPSFAAGAAKGAGPAAGGTEAMVKKLIMAVVGLAVLVLGLVVALVVMALNK